MKFRILSWFAAIGFFAVLCTPFQLAGQQQENQPASTAAISANSVTAPGNALAIVHGMVIDEDSKSAIAGAIVEWKHCHLKMQGTTDAQGAFALAIPVAGACGEDEDDDDDSGDSSEVAVSVRANLYETDSKTITIHPGRTSKLDFSLEHKSADEIGTVEGQVTDATTGKGVGGVTVSITNAGGDLSTTTQSDGSYVIAGVGFARELHLHVFREVSSCLFPAADSFELAGPIAEESFSLNPIITHTFPCPKIVTALRGVSPAGTPNFSISAAPATQSLTAGGTTTYTVSISSINGFNGTVALSASGLPTGATASFNPTSVTGGAGTSTLLVSTITSTPAGTYTLTITGVKGKHSHSATVVLIVSPAPLPTDSTVKWQQADGSAIQINAQTNAWHAGHVNGILKLDAGGGLVVAADTGGVWQITPQGQTIPLSNSWGSVDMTSLAFGPDGSRHLYAGTWNSQESPGGVLFETDTSTADPLSNWHPVSTAPPCTSIEQILVDPVNRHILLACDNGVWWSTIPPAPSLQGTYTWKQAIPGPGLTASSLQRRFSDLALGLHFEDDSRELVATAWGGATPGNIFFFGTFSNGDLVLNAAQVSNGSGNAVLNLGRSSVASCLNDPVFMYAVAADGSDSGLGGVWKSLDAGQTWTAVSTPNAGQQGWYNNVITVSSDCNAVALGWQNGTFVTFAPFVSLTTDASWNILQDANGDLHGDVHALTFDPNDSTILYIGSDGGVASATGVSSGSTPTYASTYNQHLFDMQIYHAAASSKFAGLVAAGLQDNGVIFAQLPGQWQHLTNCGCDGLLAGFVDPAALPAGDDIILEGEFGAPYWPWGWAKSNANANPVFPFNPQQGIPIGTTQNSLPDGPPGVLGIVKSPTFTNSAAQPLYAMTGLGATVYGLYANTDGSSIHWEILGSAGAGENVTALASNDGTHVFVGTDQGNIYRLDSPFGSTAVQLTINPPDAQGNPRILALVEPVLGTAFASIQTGASNGYVLAWSGQAWSALGGGLPNSLPFSTIEDQNLGAFYAATRNKVYVTYDQGNSWFNASDGLPTVSQGTELHLIIQPDGMKYLYLGTYGRSLWRALIP